jgi:putative ABC transport system permease protein
VTGILKLAYKLLVNDKAKFTALLVGITFAVFLMIAMTSLFAGVLYRASATVVNLGAPMWIMDPSVQTIARERRFPPRPERGTEIRTLDRQLHTQ